MSLYCGYNTRNGKRWISITNSTGDVLLSQTFIDVTRRCELNFNSNLDGLSCYVTLDPINGRVEEEYDYLNWSSKFNLLFIGFDYSFEDELDLNRRITLVGN